MRSGEVEIGCARIARTIVDQAIIVSAGVDCLRRLVLAGGADTERNLIHDPASQWPPQTSDSASLL
jgi:hypothetical protein